MQQYNLCTNENKCSPSEALKGIKIPEGKTSTTYYEELMNLSSTKKLFKSVGEKVVSQLVRG